MLGTIKVPINMKQLQVNLPKSQYDTDKPVKKEKKKDYVFEDSEQKDRNLGKIQEEPEDDYEREKVPPPPRSIQ